MAVEFLSEMHKARYEDMEISMNYYFFNGKALAKAPFVDKDKKTIEIVLREQPISYRSLNENPYNISAERWLNAFYSEALLSCHYSGKTSRDNYSIHYAVQFKNLTCKQNLMTGTPTNEVFDYVYTFQFEEVKCLFNDSFEKWDICPEDVFERTFEELEEFFVYQVWRQCVSPKALEAALKVNSDLDFEEVEKILVAAYRADFEDKGVEKVSILKA